MWKVADTGGATVRFPPRLCVSESYRRHYFSSFIVQRAANLIPDRQRRIDCSTMRRFVIVDTAVFSRRIAFASNTFFSDSPLGDSRSLNVRLSQLRARNEYSPSESIFCRSIELTGVSRGFPLRVCIYVRSVLYTYIRVYTVFPSHSLFSVCAYYARSLMPRRVLTHAAKVLLFPSENQDLTDSACSYTRARLLRNRTTIFLFLLRFFFLFLSFFFSIYK